MADRSSYVILMGNIGAGKSTLVEKVTGETGISSAASTIATKSCDIIQSSDDSLILCDTPGTNSICDRFQSNLEVAHAFNFMPVDLILITVKADVRIESVAKVLTEYMECFLPEDFSPDLIGFCITHMDKVTWGEDELIQCLKLNLGIEKAIFSSLEKDSMTLAQEIKDACLKNQPVKIYVDSEMFLQLFKINNNEVKILREARKEVVKFEKMKQDFYGEQKRYSKNDQKDMIFEFQAWMCDEIIETQKRFSHNNNFSFSGGPETANEAGHIANLTNQLRQILRDVRIEAMQYHVDVETDFRKCPHCGQIWQKIEGCPGDTKCGDSSSEHLKYDHVDGGKMATFFFSWNEILQKLFTRRISRKEIHARRNMGIRRDTIEKHIGCGRTINWSKMAPVKVPKGFYEADPTSTKDIKPIQRKQGETWDNHYQQNLRQKRKLKVRKAKPNFL